MRLVRIKNYMNKETLNLIKKNYPNIEIASHSYGLHYDKSIEKRDRLFNSRF